MHYQARALTSILRRRSLPWPHIHQSLATLLIQLGCTPELGVICKLERTQNETWLRAILKINKQRERIELAMFSTDMLIMASIFNIPVFVESSVLDIAPPFFFEARKRPT